jgi:hypothetical protein
MSDMQRFEKFVALADKSSAICDSDVSWETKFELIFSPEISQAIFDTDISLDYYDPDTSYEEDVLAFVSAVKHKADEIRTVLQNINSSKDE